LWYYSQHLAGNKELPKGFLPVHAYDLRRSLKNLVFPWDVEILCREFIVNAGRIEKKRLDNGTDLYKVINYIRHIENVASKETLEEEDVFLSLNRMLHKQVPWQKPPIKVRVSRYIRIYRDQKIQKIFRDKFGID
jgi:hypothetical protein